MGGGGVVLGHPAMWAFIVVKIVVDMAWMVHMHATSVILWWCHLLGTTIDTMYGEGCSHSGDWQIAANGG